MEKIKKRKPHRKITWFDYVNLFLMILLCFVMLYPFWHVLVQSLIPFGDSVKREFYFFPEHINLEGYIYVFTSPGLLKSLGNSFIVTIVGTLYQLIISCFAGYALSKKDLPGRNIFFVFIIITMFFGGGLVPFYILIKDLKLIDTLAVMIIPFFCSSFNLLVLKTFFSNLPSELEDAARVDGMGYFGIFFKIVLPLSKPVIACIALFVAVAQWNNWFTAMMFIRDADKWPVAYLLQQVLIQGNTREASGSGYVNELLLMGNTVKSAITIVSIVPIIIVYPWLQKYFVSGLTIGSVKG